MNNLVSDKVNFSDLVHSNNNFSLLIQNKMFAKLKETFDDEEERWYVANFYMYMNYHPIEDFPIDLEHVYSMIGFVNKGNSIRTLENNFIENTDYKIYEGEAKTKEEICDGKNKQKIMLNIDTFKNLCMIARTENGKKIRKYYVKLENIFSMMTKESIEEQMAKKLEEEKEKLYLEKTILSNEYYKQIKKREDIFLSDFPRNEMCVYIADLGIIKGERIIKYGESNNLRQRVECHRRTFQNFEIISAYKVINSKKIENLLKSLPEVKSRNRSLIVKNVKHFELIMVDLDYTVEKLDKDIRKLIEKNNSSKIILSELELKKLQEKTKQMEIQLKLKMLGCDISTPESDIETHNESNTEELQETDHESNTEELNETQNESNTEELHETDHESKTEELHETDHESKTEEVPEAQNELNSEETYDENRTEYGPIPQRESYLKEIEQTEKNLHNIFYSQNLHNYLCRNNNWYVLNSLNLWEYHGNFGVCVIFSSFINKIITELVEKYKPVMENKDLIRCEQICSDKDPISKKYRAEMMLLNLKNMYIRGAKEKNYPFYDKKIHRQKRITFEGTPIKFKPMKTHFRGVILSGIISDFLERKYKVYHGENFYM